MRRFAAAAAAALTILAACGTGGTALSEAAAVVRAQGTARMSMMVETSAAFPQGGELRTFTTVTRAEGVVDFAAEQARMTTEVSLPEDFGLEALDLRPCEVRVEGTTVYLAVPELDRFDGKGWVKADGSAVAGFAVEGFGTADPAGALEYLRGVSGDVEELGSEEIDGLETTHYRADASIERLLERAEADRRDQLERQLAPLREAGLETFEVEAWVDPDGIVRRMVTRMRPEGPAEPKVDVTLELGDFGEPSGVEIPAAEEVFEATDASTAESASTACFAASEG